MKYAVVQNEIRKPDFEKLLAAFRSLPELVDIDAAPMANDAYGIIVNDLDQEKAGILSAALNAEGVNARAVKCSELPKLSPAKHVRRMDCHPDYMVI